MSMKSLVALCLLAGYAPQVGFAQDKVDEKQAAADVKQFAGEWKVTKAIFRGEDGISKFGKVVFSFDAKDKTLKMRGGPKDVDFKFELMPNDGFGKIKLSTTEGRYAGQPGFGFYKLEKGKLELRMPNKPNNDNPPKDPDDETLARFVLEKKAE